MSVRSIPSQTVYNATVSSGGTHQSTSFNLGNMFSACAAYVINVNGGGGNLSATFQIMVSTNGATFYDVGMVLPSVSGSAATFVAQYPGAFPYVCVQVTRSAGSGNVTITGSAKGGA